MNQPATSRCTAHPCFEQWRWHDATSACRPFVGRLIGAVLCAGLLGVGALLDGTGPAEAFGYSLIMAVAGGFLGGIVGAVVGLAISVVWAARWPD